MSARPAKVACSCANCGREFHVPPCRLWREKSCSSACKTALRSMLAVQSRESRTRQCQHCSAAFIARATQIRDGQGRFCSNKCAIAAGSLESGRTPSANAKKAATRRASLAAGKFTIKSGPDSPYWTGGRKAAVARVCPIRRRERTRAWRKRNPDKVREFTLRRMSLKGKGSKLPPGTVARIKQLQQQKCAICRTSLAAGFHVDHVFPIALGGQHVPDNIQILCPTCNVRKSDKHPIVYMQQIGMLL